MLRARGSRSWTSGVVIGTALALGLVTGCGDEPPAPKRDRVAIVATGLLKGNLYPKVHHYSRGRTRTLGGFGSVVSQVRTLLADRAGKGGALLVDLGGNLAGSAESYASQGKIVVDMMNHLPYAASLLSNLEFAFGQDILVARAGQARFPLVASNVNAEGPLAQRLRREVTADVNGLKVAVFGVAPVNLRQICDPEAVRGVTVDPDLKSVLEAAARARKSGANLVVVLAKVAVDRPQEALRDAITRSDIDVLVGIDYGRSNFTPQKWGRTSVAGVPSDNRGVRVLVMDLDIVEGRPSVVDTTVEIVAPETSPPDPEVTRELAEYEKKTLASMGQRLCTASTPLARVYRAESPLGNLVTDAIRQAGEARIALLNAGATQDDLDAGAVTMRDLYRILPFDDTIVAVSVTGSQIEAMLAEILERGSRYHVSGARYRATETDQGPDRLVSVSVDGKPIDPKATYSLATTDYIVKRSRVLPGARPRAVGSLRDALVAYLKKQTAPIKSPLEGRVLFDSKPRGGK